MKAYLILLLILVSGSAFAQKTKKITVKSDNPPSKEVYHVLKSDKDVRHGEYIKLMDGSLLKKGEYSNNQKSGVWEYYDLNGEIIHKVNAENMEIVYENPAARNIPSDTAKYSQPLIILGGTDPLYRQVMYVLRYPEEARKNDTQGVVTVRVIFNSKGAVEKIEVVSGPGHGLDVEALRVVNLMDIEAIPALDKDGNPTTSEVMYPITFRLG